MRNWTWIWRWSFLNLFSNPAKIFKKCISILLLIAILFYLSGQDVLFIVWLHRILIRCLIKYDFLLYFCFFYGFEFALRYRILFPGDCFVILIHSVPYVVQDRNAPVH